MSYSIEFTKKASGDIELLKQSGDKSVIKKLYVLLNEMVADPRKGTGQPELLKHELAGYWSRRLNREHWIVYSIDDSVVRIVVISIKGHYK